MKVRADQLGNTLSKQRHPIYIVAGDEVLLCQEAADTIRQYLMRAGDIEERLRFIADNQFDWQEVIQETQSLSLFSSCRLFDIQIDKMGEKHTKALTQLAQELSQDQVILLTLPKLDMRVQKSKWFTSLEKQGVFVQIWPIDANRLPQWLQQRAHSISLNLSREAATLLCERGEGNLLALSQELEKLLLIHGENAKLTLDMIMDSVADSSRYSVYDLSDRLLMGKVRDALHCLDNLFAEGIEENIVLWLINREVNTLAQLMADTTDMSFHQACQAQKIWDKRIPFYESAYSRHNLTTLRYMQNYLALMDKKIKGLEGPDIKTGFRNLVMMLCGVKPTPTELDI
ncbi:DNA polymerase III subunit delta [Marinomonas sp. 15G1-11]|uniref:DNA polymerase III subunit delta n=1 Tax=Marinomonas phaeophyticola TaxID=3004091 RepID=A0ABT4JRC2_9GAMM|nr:DNA polymerase III subunit delta [Marinomonas sp. 15G1-11]MCZ2720795.1 DNA polymerase III subunit delta [Marinomonas sp. 15G1-11]